MRGVWIALIITAGLLLCIVLCVWAVKSLRKDIQRQKILIQDSKELALWKAFHLQLAEMANERSDVEVFAMDYLRELDAMRNGIAETREHKDKITK